MAKYRVTAPDGKTYEVTGPAGASDEEIAYVLHSNLHPQTAEIEPTQPLQQAQQPLPIEDNSSDFIRGFKNYIPQTKQIIGGAQVLAGKAFDQPEWIQSGAGRMKAAEAEIKSKATDSFSDAWDKGGIGAVATDWLPYQAGAGAANILEVLAASGAGALLGSAVGPEGTAAGAIAGAVEKEMVKKGVMKAAEKIVDKEAKKVFLDQEARIAAKEINKKIGRNVGISIDALMHGSGEVTQRAVQEAQDSGMSAEDIDLGVVLPAAIGHSLTDFVADKIGLAGLGGQLTQGGKSMIADIAKNIAVTGALEIPPELAQSMFERYGAGLSVVEKDALREYIDTAAAAFGMSVVPGGIGGVSAHYTGKQTPTPTPETEPPKEEIVTETPAEEEKAGKIKASEKQKGPSIAEILAAEELSDEKLDSTKSGAGVQVSGQSTDGSTKRARRLDRSRVVSGGTDISTVEDREATKPDTLTPEALLEKLKASETPIKNTSQVRNFLKGALPAGGLAQLELDNPSLVKDLFDEYKDAPELKSLKERTLKLEEANKQAKLKQEEEMSKAQFETLHPYLRTVSRYAKEAPLTKERAIESAAAEEAFNDYDLMDVKGYKNELAAIAKQKTDEALAERKANLDNLMNTEKLTKRQAENRVGTYKDFTFSSERPYDYLTPEEILAIQEKYLGKKTPSKDQVQEAMIRRDYIASLSPEEQALVAEKIQERKVKEAELNRQRVVSEKVQESEKAKEEAQVEKAVVAEEEAVTEAERQPPGARAPLTTEEKILERDKNKVNNIVTPAIAQNKTAQEILATLAGKDYNRSFAYQTTAEYFSRFLNKVKGEVKIRFGTVAEGRPGSFNPKTNTITIDKNNLGKAHIGQVVTHEMVHYAIDHLIDNRKGLTTEQQAGLKRVEALHNYVKSQIGTTEFEIDSLKEFIAEAFSNSQFQQRLAEIPKPPRSAYTVVRDLARAIVAALGLRSSNPAVLEEIIDQVDNILSGKDYLPPSKQVRGKVISYAPKQAGQPQPAKVYNREARKARINPTAYTRPNAIQIVKNATVGEKARDTLITKFQNVSYGIKKWQQDLMKAGKITVGGKDFTNIYDFMATAPGQALFRYKDKLETKVIALRQAIAEYAKATNKSMDDALFDLHEYSEALHEPERRRIKFLKTVPLSTKANIKIGNKTYSAAGLRDAIFDRVSENVVISKAELKALRDKLDAIVDAKDATGKFKYRDKLGDGKYQSIDENSADYNVTAELNPSDVAQIMASYSPEQKAQMDKVLEVVKPIQEATVALNKEGNYWSQTTDNIKNFYDWKHYVPLKGKGIKMPSNIDFLNLEDKRLSNELKDAPMAMEGRMSEAENTIERIMADASISAARAGRVGLTQAIKNAVNQKLIEGKVVATYTPEEIYKGLDPKGQELMKQRSSIVHYNEDGTMDIIKIADPTLLESIRRTYREGHPMIDLANRITSFIGQTHTRYNPAFPILNFVRDTLTNAFVMAIDVSPKEAFKYVTAVATSVVNGGLFKANRAMRAYNRGDIAAIRELAKKDDYYKDMLEFMSHGGLVSVISGLSVKSQQNQLYKELNQNKVLATKEQIDKFFDGYVGMFEMAARIGAYRVVKSDMRSKGIPEQVASEKAAVYTKQLANFEEVGEWGKALGALFVFFRPSATGAVRAFESIGPALRSWESVYRSLPDNIRNDPQALSTYEANWRKQSDTARATIICLIGAGMATYAAAAMLADDDDEGRNKILSDDLARWTRFARFDIGKDEAGREQVIQIPWGFGLGGFMAAGAQIAGGLSSNSNTLGELFSNVMNIGLDSFIPLPVSRINMVDNPAAFVVDSMMPSVARPFVEYTMNMNAFGQEIYNNRNSRYGDAYTGGDSIPDLYKDVARFMVDNWGVDISPNSLYFFANNYADGMTRLAQNSYGLELTLSGAKDFDLKRDTVFLESFFSTKSNVDQREFARMEKAVLEKEKMLNMFKTNPEKYAEYIAEHPYDKVIVDMYNRQINGTLKRLREQANQYRRMPGLDPKTRNALLQPNKEMQNLTKRMATYQINTLVDATEN